MNNYINNKRLLESYFLRMRIKQEALLYPPGVQLPSFVVEQDSADDGHRSDPAVQVHRVAKKEDRHPDQ